MYYTGEGNRLEDELGGIIVEKVVGKEEIVEKWLELVFGCFLRKHTKFI